MEFYIKENEDKSAVIFSETGEIVFSVNNLNSAIKICEEWYQMNREEMFEFSEDYQDASCSSCMI